MHAHKQSLAQLCYYFILPKVVMNWHAFNLKPDGHLEHFARKGEGKGGVGVMKVVSVVIRGQL